MTVLQAEVFSRLIKHLEHRGVKSAKITALPFSEALPVANVPPVVRGKGG